MRDPQYNSAPLSVIREIQLWNFWISTKLTTLLCEMYLQAQLAHWHCQIEIRWIELLWPAGTNCQWTWRWNWTAQIMMSKSLMQCFTFNILHSSALLNTHYYQLIQISLFCRWLQLSQSSLLFILFPHTGTSVCAKNKKNYRFFYKFFPAARPLYR